MSVRNIHKESPSPLNQDVMIATLVQRGLGKASELRALAPDVITTMFNGLSALPATDLVSTHHAIQEEGAAAKQFILQTRESSKAYKDLSEES